MQSLSVFVRTRSMPASRANDGIGVAIKHLAIYVVGRVREAYELRRMRTRMNGKLWEEMSEEEHRLYPNDVEAMVGQGVIAKHAEEHLVTSDRGIVMLRRLLRAQLRAVAEGRDPAGVSFDPEAPPAVFTAGNWLAE